MHLLNYIQLYLHELSELMVLQNIDSKLKGVHPKMHVHSTDDLNFRKYSKKPNYNSSHSNSAFRLFHVYMCTSGRKSGKGCYVYEAKSKEKKVNSGAEEILKSFKLTAPPAV